MRWSRWRARPGRGGNRRRRGADEGESELASETQAGRAALRWWIILVAAFVVAGIVFRWVLPDFEWSGRAGDPNAGGAWWVFQRPAGVGPARGR